MAQIATTKEQSKKLLELGLSADTADMHWHYYLIDSAYQLCSHKIKDISVYDNRREIPAWSLSKLLELMPLPLLTQHNNNKWYMATYPNGKHISLEEYDNPIDAAFEMMCYLLKNKLIKQLQL